MWFNHHWAGSAVTYTLSSGIAKTHPLRCLVYHPSFADDTIKINEEYMTVEAVGVGGPNFVTVRRSTIWFNSYHTHLDHWSPNSLVITTLLETHCSW